GRPWCWTSGRTTAPPWACIRHTGSRWWGCGPATTVRAWPTPISWCGRPATRPGPGPGIGERRVRTVMGIESSCDETGVAVARVDDDGRAELLSDVVASSMSEHARFGGVVP